MSLPLSYKRVRIFFYSRSKHCLNQIQDYFDDYKSKFLNVSIFSKLSKLSHHRIIPCLSNVQLLFCLWTVNHVYVNLSRLDGEGKCSTLHYGFARLHSLWRTNPHFRGQSFFIFTLHLPFIYLTFILHLLNIYLTFTLHLPYIYLTFFFRTFSFPLTR